MWISKLIFGSLVLTSCLAIELKDISVSAFAKELDLWVRFEQETELFKEAIDLLQLPKEHQLTDLRSYANGNAAICTICQSSIKTFLDLRREGMSLEEIGRKVTKLCVKLNVQKENVCRGVIELNAPIIVHIADTRPNLTASTICGVVLDSRYCPINDPEFDWTIDVDSNSALKILEHKSEEPVKVLQVSDLHYDPNYEPYGHASCGEPVCCRKGQKKTDTSTEAGFWGDYGYCDTPWHAVLDALDWMRGNHQDISYVYYTGDIIDHGVWETSTEGNIESIIKSYNQIYMTFSDIPVYPILGNHEPHPLNQFAPRTVTQENLTTQWLYKLLADLWIGFGWLPESTRSTIMEGGYYTLSPKKGFRVVVLNSNVCYCYNWWILYTPKDPDNQLQWLANTLLEAERNGEFVHILSHIPPNDKDCLRVWRREYLRVISRFSHVVKAQFNGHTHSDELSVLYDKAVPMNVAWNGGSVTAFANLNPNYKVYTVNASSYAVIDYENWMYNLTAANKNPEIRPTWYKSYSFKEEYAVADLSPESLSNWLFAAANDETMLNKYFRHFYKHAEPSLKKDCDSQCKKQYMCRVIASAQKEELCKNIQSS